MMFMNTLTLISDRSYCLWLLHGAEADAQRHINNNGKGRGHPATGRGGRRSSG